MLGFVFENETVSMFTVVLAESDLWFSFSLISDEPVTEGYSILGFPIWWGTRRNGSCMSPPAPHGPPYLAASQCSLAVLVLQRISFARSAIVTLNFRIL